MSADHSLAILCDRIPKTNPVDIARSRLANQFLVATSFTTGAAVVRALGAVQAQDYPGAKWALAQRTTGIKEKDIERELTEGTFIRTHVLRPTWHFVTPSDIRWMLELTAPRVKSSLGAYHRQLELTDAVCRRSYAAMAKALAGGKYLTRAELRSIVSRARIGEVTPSRMGHLMLRAELDAVVCSGPRRGKQFTYALLDERVPATPLIDRDEALLELARRYFATRGPATANDFAWWSGLSMADVRRAVEIASSFLSSRSLNGRQFYFTALAPGRVRPTAHLLPAYDEFFIGLKDRSAMGSRLGTVKAVTEGSALTFHVLVVDGQLVGVWRQVFAPSGVMIDLKLLVPLKAAERKRVRDTVRRYEDFLGVRAELRGFDGGLEG